MQRQVCEADFCGSCEASHDHECYAPLADDLKIDDGFDESDAYSDDVQMALEQEEREIQREETEKPEFLLKGTAKAEEAAFPEGGIILNKFTGVAHKACKECKPVCGTRLSEKNQEMHLSPEAMVGMSLCWRRGCAPWERAEPYQFDQLDQLFVDLTQPDPAGSFPEVFGLRARLLW